MPATNKLPEIRNMRRLILTAIPARERGPASRHLGRKGSTETGIYVRHAAINPLCVLENEQEYFRPGHFLVFHAGLRVGCGFGRRHGRGLCIGVCQVSRNRADKVLDLTMRPAAV